MYKKFLKKNKKIIMRGALVASTIALAIVFVVRLTPNHVAASGTQAVHGFLWSDMPDGSDECLHGTGGETPNTCGNHSTDNATDAVGRGFGWISLNSSDTNAQTNAPIGGTYSVGLDSTTGNLSGYGWSEYAGWLDFAPAGPYPTVNGTNAISSHSAQVDPVCIAAHGTNCLVSGWIRFPAGITAGDWDGWVNLSYISLAPNVPTYAVTYDSTTGKFSGYAWGSTDAGWIDFSRAYADKSAATCQDPNAANYNQALPCVCNGVGTGNVGNTYSYTYIPPICSNPPFNGTISQLPGTPPVVFNGKPGPNGSTGTLPNGTNGTNSSTGGVVQGQTSHNLGGTLPQSNTNTNATQQGNNLGGVLSQPNSNQGQPGGQICVAQTVYPPQCSTTPPGPLTCYDNKTNPPTLYTYNVGSPIPPQCLSINPNNQLPQINYCIDHKTGTLVSYPAGSNPPAGCTPTTCSVAFQINGTGVWYGPVNGGAQNGGTCVASACPKNISMGFVASIPTGYVMNANGMCVKSGTGGGPGSTVPITPVYKEK